MPAKCEPRSPIISEVRCKYSYFFLNAKIIFDLFIEPVASDCDEGGDEGHQQRYDEKKYHDWHPFIF